MRAGRALLLPLFDAHSCQPPLFLCGQSVQLSCPMRTLVASLGREPAPSSPRSTARTC